MTAGYLMAARVFACSRVCACIIGFNSLLVESFATSTISITDHAGLIFVCPAGPNASADHGYTATYGIVTELSVLLLGTRR